MHILYELYTFRFNINDTILHPEITELSVCRSVFLTQFWYELCFRRVFKTEQEVDVIRSTCRISGEAHKEVIHIVLFVVDITYLLLTQVMRKARPGLYEYHLER